MDEYDDRAVTDNYDPDQMHHINAEDIDLDIPQANPISPYHDYQTTNDDGFPTPLQQLKSNPVEHHDEWTVESTWQVADYMTGIFEDIKPPPILRPITISPKAQTVRSSNSPTFTTAPVDNSNRNVDPIDRTTVPPSSTCGSPDSHRLPTADATSTSCLLQFLAAVKSATITLNTIDTTTVYSTIASLESKLAVAKSDCLSASLIPVDIELLKSKAAEAQIKEAEWQQKYHESNGRVVDIEKELCGMKANVEQNEMELLEVREQLAGLLLASRQVDEKIALKELTIKREIRRALKGEEEIRKLRAQLHRPESTSVSSRRSATPPRDLPHKAQQGRAHDTYQRQQGFEQLDMHEQTTQHEEFPNPMAGLEEDLPRPYKLDYAAHERQQAARLERDGHRPDHNLLTHPQESAHPDLTLNHPKTLHQRQMRFTADGESSYYDSSYRGRETYRTGRGRGWRRGRDDRASGPYDVGRRTNHGSHRYDGEYGQNDDAGYYDTQRARQTHSGGREGRGERRIDYRDRDDTDEFAGRGSRGRQD